MAESVPPIEPIRLSTIVAQAPAEAFHLFTEGIGSWWPLHEGYSFGGARAEAVYLEPVAGGRFYERYKDGQEYDVGHVLACEPPRRIVFTWKGEWPASTEIEIRFVPEGSGTRVDFEHRGWERLGADGLQRRASYANGWPTILARYRAGAGAATD